MHRELLAYSNAFQWPEFPHFGLSTVQQFYSRMKIWVLELSNREKFKLRNSSAVDFLKSDREFHMINAQWFHSINLLIRHD